MCEIEGSEREGDGGGEGGVEVLNTQKVCHPSLPSKPCLHINMHIKAEKLKYSEMTRNLNHTIFNFRFKSEFIFFKSC